MMSSFFKTATIAALSGIVAYLASFLPFMVAITLENEMTYTQKVLTVSKLFLNITLMINKIKNSLLKFIAIVSFDVNFFLLWNDVYV